MSLANTRFWKKVFAGIQRHRATRVSGFLFVDLYESLQRDEHIQIWSVTRHEAHAAIRYVLSRLGMYEEYPVDRDFCIAALYVFGMLVSSLRKRGRPRMTSQEARRVLERNAAIKSSQRSRMSAHVQAARQRIRAFERLRQTFSPMFEGVAHSEDEERILGLLGQVLEENSLEFMA